MTKRDFLKSALASLAAAIGLSPRKAAAVPAATPMPEAMNSHRVRYKGVVIDLINTQSLRQEIVVDRDFHSIRRLSLHVRGVVRSPDAESVRHALQEPGQSLSVEFNNVA